MGGRSHAAEPGELVAHGAAELHPRSAVIATELGGLQQPLHSIKPAFDELPARGDAGGGGQAAEEGPRGTLRAVVAAEPVGHQGKSSPGWRPVVHSVGRAPRRSPPHPLFREEVDVDRAEVGPAGDALAGERVLTHRLAEQAHLRAALAVDMRSMTRAAFCAQLGGRGGVVDLAPIPVPGCPGKTPFSSSAPSWGR